MTLFLGKWKIFDEHRERCMTYFASMSELDDANESPGVEVIGRWSDLGTASGFVVCLANDYNSVASWMYNWAPMADITVKPVCDDSTARSIILGKDPPPPKEQTLTPSSDTTYAIEYEFYDDKRQEAMKAFASMTPEQDQADAGRCVCLGRWHDLGNGSGLAIARAKNEKDIYAWANNWSSLCKCKITPVLSDHYARQLIRSKPDFATKLKQLTMSPPRSRWGALCKPFFSTTPGHADGL